MTNKNLIGIKDYGRLVYVPDKIHGYVLARLVDIGAETLSVELIEKNLNCQNLVKDFLKFFLKKCILPPSQNAGIA